VLDVAYCALALAFFAMLAGAYNLIRMASFIESRPGAFGFRPLWAEGSYFTDPIGLKYRRNCIICFLMMALFMLVFALLIARMPNFNM
jgi:hypothetical protein